MDLAAWAEDNEIDPRDVRAMALRDFAASVNAATGEQTLPAGSEPGSDNFRESADAIANQIIQHGRDSK